ncbi:MAG: substrate-binding domain-containing protein [Bacteroidia bacterium]|nr:substrate-binding domain-containing protein [Bacteroidia bacterium]
MQSSFNKYKTPLLKRLQQINLLLIVPVGFLFFISCGNYFKNDYKDNSPTSGKLRLYYDEGLSLHAKNQVFTFESQYTEAHVDMVESNENAAIEALYKDSCEAIMISRLLNDKEKKAFESKQFFPKYSAVAKSGVAIITNIQTPLNGLSRDEIIQILLSDGSLKDSLNQSIKIRALLDRNNSSVIHYLMDSVLKAAKFSGNCSVLKSSAEAINFVAQNKNTVAFIDFAWLSDVDDSITKANTGKIKFIGIKDKDGKTLQFPSQSSFKLGTYPFGTTVYVIRKTGDFTLAKGFESFVAGPKGQLTFLKQGLLPARQAERLIEVKFEPMQQ